MKVRDPTRITGGGTWRSMSVLAAAILASCAVDQASENRLQASDLRLQQSGSGQSETLPAEARSLKPEAALPVGSPFVDFGLKRLDPKTGELGEIVWLSDFAGKDARQPKRAVLLNFFATWCEPCKAELPVLVELHKKYSAAGLHVLSINFHDEDEEIETVLKKSAEIARNAGLLFPVLVDRYTNRNQLIYMGSKAALPCNVLLNSEGMVTARFQGGRSATMEELERAIETLLGGAKKDEQQK